MTEYAQSILALLDQGIVLYRRNFAGFVLIAASWFVPVAIAAGLITAAASRLDRIWTVVLTLAALLALFPLLIYLIGGLSRAAVAAAEGRPVRFREVMAIHPFRAVGMGCFTIVYTIISQIVSSFLSLACVCPLYIVGLMMVGIMAAATSSGGIAAAGLLGVGIILVGLYGGMMIVGATGSGLFYGLQPWVQEARPFGETLQRSLELLGYRFLRNLLVWGMAALLVAAVGLTVTATIGTVLPLPLTYALGSDSPITQAVAVGAWLIGFVVVLPPLPIWMALLYRQNRAAREGADLQTSVHEWLSKQVKNSEVRIQESDEAHVRI
jgi:hypothetical protein